MYLPHELHTRYPADAEIVGPDIDAGRAAGIVGDIRPDVAAQCWAITILGHLQLDVVSVLSVETKADVVGQASAGENIALRHIGKLD